MIERREEKDEAGFAETLDGEFRREFDGNAESLENVGSAAARGDGAIAVLGDARSGGCGNERGTAGDVEGLRAAAAGADAIDELRSFLSEKGKWHGVPAHDVDKAGQLRSLLAARGEDGKERGGFHFRHAAGEDLLEDLGRLLTGERRAILGQRAKQFLHQRHERSIAERRLKSEERRFLAHLHGEIPAEICVVIWEMSEVQSI